MKNTPHQQDDKTTDSIRILLEALEKNKGNAIVLNEAGLSALQHLVSAIPSPTLQQQPPISEILTRIYALINKVKVWLAISDTGAAFKTINEMTEYILSIDVNGVIDPTSSPSALSTSTMSCKTALMTLLDQVDYTSGACRVNEMVGAVLPAAIIALAKQAIENEK